jgi:hypothetical protein
MIHEAPIFSRGRAGKLSDRVPITIEPGMYLRGAGVVRIGDTLVVRAGAGAAEAPWAAELSQPPTTIKRELLVLQAQARTGLMGAMGGGPARMQEKQLPWPPRTISRTA